MRVAKKEIRDSTIIEEILAAEAVGRLGATDRNGYPVIKPLNFVHYRGRIYFHSAPEGEKIEAILRDGRVCFEVDQPVAYVRSVGIPCNADYLYRSVVIRGRAHLVCDGEEKTAALKALMEKYQPEGGYGGFPEERLAKTAVVRIDILEMTAKQDLGKETEREAALRLLAAKAPPAIFFERS